MDDLDDGFIFDDDGRDFGIKYFGIYFYYNITNKSKEGSKGWTPHFVEGVPLLGAFGALELRSP